MWQVHGYGPVVGTEEQSQHLQRDSQGELDGLGLRW
ncbi:hypothetical protein BN970_02250 [Mycolicibacterium conceptionense]|uniref:Uncharacterized protein n=1 Tax=Mycolicibacterium conceptionense TaxID=451644 RepID=A0A0U1DA73_9MYCO|nr:hypothetical protein BN970_02250 [Mycolicibacterium conceptionense]